MATVMMTSERIVRAVKPVRQAPIPKALRQKAEEILAGTYAFMDSEFFHKKNAEVQLFAEGMEPELPLTSWYQPTREEMLDSGITGAPKLMSAAEERLMFLRFNYAKLRLGQVQAKVKKTGLTKELATDAIEWHRRFEHFREYLTRTNLALVLAMAKRTRLGDVDFAEVVSEGNMALLRAVEKFSIDRGFKFSTYA